MTYSENKKEKQLVITELNRVYKSLMEVRMKLIELNKCGEQFDCVNNSKLNVIDDIEREVKLIDRIIGC